MKDKICEICKNIEKEEKIQILFVVESGSRAWNLESQDSDYDVRFVFKREYKEYLKINKPNEVIIRHYNKEGERCQPENCFIDIEGFDIYKFAKMLWSSNPTVIEWLESNMIYYGKKNKVFVNFAENYFKPISLYYHYKSMCRQNYLKYLKSKSLVTYKKYLYAMRGLVNAKWIVRHCSLPPIDFNRTINNKGLPIPDEVVNKLRDIIQKKKESREKDIIQNIVMIDNYIEDFLKSDDEAPKEKRLNKIDILEEEILRLILKQ